MEMHSPNSRIVDRRGEFEEFSCQANLIGDELV